MKETTNLTKTFPSLLRIFAIFAGAILRELRLKCFLLEYFDSIVGKLNHNLTCMSNYVPSFRVLFRLVAK